MSEIKCPCCDIEFTFIEGEFFICHVCLFRVSVDYLPRIAAAMDAEARHNALVEAVTWHLECDSCPLKNTTEAEKHGFAAIWATRRAARAEVDRLIGEGK